MHPISGFCYAKWRFSKLKHIHYFEKSPFLFSACQREVQKGALCLLLQRVWILPGMAVCQLQWLPSNCLIYLSMS